MTLKLSKLIKVLGRLDSNVIVKLAPGRGVGGGACRPAAARVLPAGGGFEGMPCGDAGGAAAAAGGCNFEGLALSCACSPQACASPKACEPPPPPAGAADASIAVYDTQQACAPTNDTGGVGGGGSRSGGAGEALGAVLHITKQTPGAHRFSVSAVAWYPVDTGLFVSGA